MTVLTNRTAAKPTKNLRFDDGGSAEASRARAGEVRWGGFRGSRRPCPAAAVTVLDAVPWCPRRSQPAPRLVGGAGLPIVMIQQPGQQLGQPLSLLR